MKILSITDVITNSSTEVFIIVDRSDVSKVKDLINSILSIGKSPYTCDDIFNIEYAWDWEVLQDYWEDYHKNYDDFANIENPTKDELSAFGEIYVDDNYDSYIPEPYIAISAKDGSEVPECLQKIGNIFGETRTVYC